MIQKVLEQIIKENIPSLVTAKVKAFLDQIKNWMSKPINYSWIWAVVQGLCIVLISFWIRQPPFLGIGVAALGLVAIFMAIRAEQKWSKIERAAWFIVATGLLIVEITAIRDEHDRHESEMEAIRKQEQADRTSAAKARADDRAAFAALLQTGKDLFQHQSALSKEDRDQMTGGDSYIVVVPDLGLSVEGPNTFVLLARIGKNGKRLAVPEAHIQVRKLPIPNEGKKSELLDVLTGKNQGSVFVGTISPDWAQILPTRITPSPEGISEYVVNVVARNNPTVETLRVRHNPTTGNWE